MDLSFELWFPGRGHEDVADDERSVAKESFDSCWGVQLRMEEDFLLKGVFCFIAPQVSEHRLPALHGDKRGNALTYRSCVR